MTVKEISHRGMADPSMLERIDALFSCGAGEHVDIPQIIVIGDQSSGKSSVLSGLLRKDLPRDSGLCTRFATKIVFRRDIEAGVRIFITPDENASPEHRAQVETFAPIQLDTFSELDFQEVLSAVQEAIGIASSNEDASTKPAFSADVLQLEISGPDEEHLSVIDIPGIFRDHTPGLTTKDDIKFVRETVMKYMANPRSVMLAVIPANGDVATQEILQLANDADPEGYRTLGVLTKPDLVDRGTEHRVIDLVQGTTRPMRLGWHILRNPGKLDLDDRFYDRQRQENDFFCKSPWNCLDEESWGIESLRCHLKDVLSELVRKEFMNVKADVQRKVDSIEEKLKALGPERTSRTAKAAFLTELATKFQQLVDSGLAANFGANRLFEKHKALKVAPATVLRMEQFKSDMIHWGHKYQFHNTDEDHGMSESNKAAKDPGKELKLRKRANHHDGLENLLCTFETISSRHTGKSTDQWLHQLHGENRGFELGTFDPIILASAMKKQTANWERISSGFIGDIIVLVHDFIKTAISDLCQNERLEAELCNIVFDEAMTRYKTAIDQLKFILTVELDGTPLTQDPHFMARLDKCRKHIYEEGIRKKAFDDDRYGLIVRLDDMSFQPSTCNEHHVVRDIHDILHSYYDVARTRFIDNVCKQAADHFLVNGPDTPLRVLSPVFISKLTDEKLEQIAGEEPIVKRQREKLQKDMNSLTEAMRILS